MKFASEHMFVGGDIMLWFKDMGNVARLGRDSDARRIEEIPIDLIKPNPYQPRKKFSVKALEELSQSIDEYGLIHPITVRKISDENYELIAGERRLRATKMLGVESISAIIIESVDKDSAMIAMIENLQRENLHFIEEAKGYESLMEDHGFTQDALAKKLGKSQSTIANKLRILKLSDEIKKIIRRENLTERHARALLRLPSEDMQKQVLDKIIDNGLNVKETDLLVESLIKEDEERSSRERRKFVNINNDFRIFINTIKNAVDMIKQYGLEPEYTQIEDEDSIEIVVRITKG